MMDRRNAKIAACALAVGFVGGMALEWKILSRNTVAQETAAPAASQADGSLILERKPDPDAKPEHQIPKGARVERIVKVTVKPTQSTEDPAPTPGTSLEGVAFPPFATAPGIPCSPVRVDLTLIRMPDLTRRVIASSPDGSVSGGIDIPVEQPRESREPAWTVSGLAGYDFRRRCKVYGAMASRNAGPFVVQSGFIGETAFVGAGVRW